MATFVDIVNGASGSAIAADINEIYALARTINSGDPLPANIQPLLQQTTIAGVRSQLGLGTAATLSVGTVANSVVQLDGQGRLPAVDGSQLTNLPSGAGTDLAYTPSTRLLTSSTGTDVTLPEVVAGGNAGLMTGAQAALLSTAVQPAAIANFETSTQLNSRDTANRSRSNHTGTQSASTISDFSAAVNAVVGTQGTAAALNAGTAVGNVVQLVNIGGGTAGLPAIDGSLLTGIATGGGGASWGSISGTFTSQSQFADSAAFVAAIGGDTAFKSALNLAYGDISGSLAISNITDLATTLDSKAGLTLGSANLTYGATVNLDMAAISGAYRTISLTGNLTLTASNRAAGRHVSVRLVADASNRTLTFPGSWRFIGNERPTAIAANKVAILTITFFGTTDADAVCAYAVEP